MPLEPFMHQFLLRLERSHMDNLKWVSIADVDDIPANVRSNAVKLAYVEARGANASREYQLAPGGKTALGDNAEHQLRQMRGQLAVNGHSRIAPYQPEAASPDMGMLSNGDMDEFDIEFVEPPPIVQAVAAESIPLHTGKTCVECDQPRYKSSTRCEAHAKAYWLERDKAKKNRKRLAAAEPSITEDDTTPDLQPVTTPIIESAADYIPVIHPPVEIPAPAVRLIARAAVNAIVLIHRVKGN